MSVVQIIFQIVFPILAIGSFFVYVLLPWKKAGRISKDGLWWFAWLLLVFWDPMLNFFQNIAVYNPNMVNLGSWTMGSFPGWGAPRTNYMAEPLLVIPPVYVLLLPAVMAGCALIKWLRNKGLSAPLCIVVSAIILMIVSIVLEGLLFFPLGINAIPGAAPSLTIFSGSYHQYPVYHALFFGAWLAGAAALKFFTDARGDSVAERGLDRIDRSDRTKTFIRFLAIFAANVVILAFTYWIPMQFFALKSGPWPTSITEKSYFTGNMCGGNTGYACPGPAIPIPRQGSAHVAPDGSLVVPQGTELPPRTGSGTEK
ncbi:spirocyclase AveC family protein [Nocardia sp. NPDC004123]